MGVGDHAILAVGSDVDPVALDTLREMIDEESELISIYYGEDIKEEEAEVLGQGQGRRGASGLWMLES